jgi:hypothetical protein
VEVKGVSSQSFAQASGSVASSSNDRANLAGEVKQSIFAHAVGYASEGTDWDGETLAKESVHDGAYDDDKAEALPDKVI